jgi:hypothetical protein
MYDRHKPKPDISADDIEDVREMTHKLEDAMRATLSGQELCLAISALMSATVNCVIDQCETIDQLEHYQEVFSRVFQLGIDEYKQRIKTDQ